MLEKIFMIALTITNLNNAKPRIENEFNIQDGTPRILKATDDEAKDIILNSYYYKLTNNELIDSGISQENEFYPISIRYWTSGAPNPNKFIHNQVYFLCGGYPYNYPGIIGDETADYIVNPYGTYGNDGEYYHLMLNKEQWEEYNEEGTSLVSSISDYSSGYGNYGILIPKETYYEDAVRAEIKINALSINYYSDSLKTDENPQGINTDLTEPAFIKYENYAPFRNKTQNTNYLTNEHGKYEEINDGLTTSTADDNMYYYDAIFDNNYFINRALGVGNYAVNAMYLRYPSGPDYEYYALSMYNIAPSYMDTTYQLTLNDYYNDIGGYNQIVMNHDYLINRITNAENKSNGNNWTYTYANEFIILDPNKTKNGIDQMQILESHMIAGYTIKADDISITIDADLGDVFHLLGMAFTGFGSFFSILILPGLTLGTLFIMPLIVSLVIWLIHLFKRH